MSGTSGFWTVWWDRLRGGPRAASSPSENDDSHNSPSSVVILNSDDEITSPEGITWLLKCIFRETDLRRYVVSQNGAEIARSKTFREANQYLSEYYRQRVENPLRVRPSALEKRAYYALVVHQKETALNENAYQGNRQNLPESGYWPNPSIEQNGRSLFQELPFRRRSKFITKTTPLVSAGSCFALEIAHELQKEGYRYVVTERNFRGLITQDTSVLSDASAAWGIIFNSPSFRQLVERSFGLRQLPSILWQNGEKYMDPFREEITFASIEEYRSNWKPHLEASRAAFLQAEVLIITLGLNEIWSFKMDGSVFSRSPWRIAPSFVEHRVLTVAENVRDLDLMLKILRRHNPKLQIIVTLSPIPLHATFLHDRYHVVEANMHSKAVLRVAAQEFVEKNEGVHYFPSFELITYGFENPWREDHRHVTRAVVSRVMEMFRDMFVVERSFPST
jgi:hypothetical protein